MLRCPLPLSLFFSHVCGGVSRGESLLQQVGCRIRYVNPAVFCSLDMEEMQNWKTMSLFMEYFCFGKGGYFSLKMLFVIMSRWIVI